MDQTASTFSNPRPQAFPFRDPLTKYISMNYTAELYKKLIMSCKLFFAQKPLLVVDAIICPYQKQGYYYDEEKAPLILEKLQANKTKLWITEKIDCFDFSSLNLAANLLPYIYRFEGNCIHLWDQELTYDEYRILMKLSKKLATVWFSALSVKYPDGSFVPAEKLFMYMYDLKDICL